MQHLITGAELTFDENQVPNLPQPRLKSGDAGGTWFKPRRYQFLVVHDPALAATNHGQLDLLVNPGRVINAWP